MVAKDPSLFAVFFDQRPRLDDAYREQIVRKEREYVRRFATIVANAVESGVVADVDPRHAAHALIGMTSWTYKWFDPERDDPDQMARTMIGLVIGTAVDLNQVVADVTPAEPPG